MDDRYYSKPEADEYPALPKFPGVRVLLAEDTLVNQQFAEMVLEEMEIEVEIAEDGLKTVQLWQQGKFDLILMDCFMPEMDGYEATRKIRLFEKEQKHIPIIAVTANVVESAKQDCLNAGMDDFLSKPYEDVELGNVLSRWLLENASLENPLAVSADANASVPEGRVKNLEKIERLQKSLGARFEKLVAGYVENSEELLSNFKQAVADNDLGEMERMVHSIKSSTANFGECDLVELAQTMEDEFRLGQVLAVDEKSKKLEQEVQDFCTWLNDYQGRQQ